MFYCNDNRPVGQIADYRLDCPMKQKAINFYVQDVPLVADEAAKLQTLYAALPKGLPYGIRTRVWKTFFPDTLFLGEFISYNIWDDLGQAVEVMTPYNSFIMANVPWEDIIA